ncbi:MAG: peptidoglycan-associated lipoprotein Pal [Methylophilaceae bacterium]|nr:peptidoglycan-associated lipoprotein Pal [Methylophilaceae bacterium]
MENKTKLLMTLAISIFLVACKSTPMKEVAVVEDKSTTAMTTTDDSSDVVGAVIDGSGGDSNMNELNDPNNILSQRNIYFDFDSDAIRAEFRPNIEAHAKYLQSHSNAKVTLQGNADERGTREYNLSLGQRRSVAVKTALNLLGVSDSQIETISYGEENANPACADDACYQNDRRVEIVYPNE